MWWRPALLAALLPWSGTAQAQISVDRTPAVAPQLGNVVSGSSVTTFRVTAQGAVTRVSGNALRLSSSAVTSPTISIGCGLLNLDQLCLLRFVRVTIAPVGSSTPARIVRLRIGALAGATYRDAAPAEGATLTFQLNPLGLLGVASFKLGMDVELAVDAAPGPATFDYIVTAAFL